jgi:hypothetical protein
MATDKVYELNPNGWYMKLMKWMWNVDYTAFSHVCPIVWLTAFNLIIFIPYVVVRYAGVGIYTAGSWVEKQFDQSFDRWAENYIKVLQGNPHERELLADRMVRCGRSKGRIGKLWDRIQYNYQYSTLAQDINTDYYKLRDHRALTERERQIASKKRISNAVMKIKPVLTVLFWILAFALVMLIGYWIYKFFAAMARVTPDWNQVLLVIAILAGIAIAVFIIYWCVKNVRIPCYIKSGIGRPFVWLWDGIVKIVSIIADMVRNNCPGVTWKEKV